MPDSDFWKGVVENRDGASERQPHEILQRLYDSEINLRLGWIWDGGVTWQLGDKHNGWKASGNAATVALAVLELAKAAAAQFPGSEFAKWWKPR